MPEEHQRLYPLQIAVDNRRLENELEAEESGGRRPRAIERRITSRNRAFVNGNWDAVSELDRDREWRSTVSRNAIQRKKDRKRESDSYLFHRGYGHNHNPDPRSDDDDAGPKF